MSFVEEATQKKIHEQEEKLEHLSDFSRDLDSTTPERNENGEYLLPLSAEDYRLVCDAVRNQTMSTARDLQARKRAVECGSEDGNLTSHSEKQMLKGCIGLLSEAVEQFGEYLEFIDAVPPDPEEKFVFGMRYSEIVNALFLSGTMHSGGTSTAAKCRELGVDYGTRVRLTPYEELKEKQITNDTPLKAGDITDLEEICREYDEVTGTSKSVFTCNVREHPDILTYEWTHPNSQQFTLHTERDDIWHRMSADELKKLERVVNGKAAFNQWMFEIDQAASPEALAALQKIFWDEADPKLSLEQYGQINERFAQKQKEFHQHDFHGENESWIFDSKDSADCYAIYQLSLERMNENRYLYMGLDYVKRHGMKVNGADYDMIYGGPLAKKETLDSIYEKFNLDRPQDFTGHSLSISDVIVLRRNGETKAFYIDSWSFAELPDFLAERQAVYEQGHKQERLKKDISAAVSALETKAREDMRAQNSPWGSWFGRIADPQKPENYIALDITGYTTRNSVTLSAQIVRKNEVQDMVLIPDMPYGQFIGGETSFARQVVGADKAGEYSSVCFYNPHGLMDAHPMEEHYDLLRQVGFDDDFPDNQAYAQRVTEQQQKMTVSSEQNARRSTPGRKR